jgi:heme/copper-type cytochrome/quinol oxidase subunit 2
MNKFKYISILGWAVVGIPTILVALMIFYSIKYYRPINPYPHPNTKVLNSIQPEPVKAQEAPVSVVAEEPKKVLKRSIKKETTRDSANINDSSYNNETVDSTVA